MPADEIHARWSGQGCGYTSDKHHWTTDQGSWSSDLGHTGLWLYFQAWNWDLLVANATKNWALVAKCPELVASWHSHFVCLKLKMLFLSEKVRKQRFANLTNKNNKETDHFEEVFLAKQRPNITKITLFAHKQFLTSRCSTCLLVMGLGTR